MSIHPSASVPRSPRLALDDTATLLRRYARHKDGDDREELVRRFLPLALKLSRKYFSADEEEDLQQVASLALLKAIDRFDPSRGFGFTSFAVPTILGELKRYFRDQGWSVYVPRRLKELRPVVEETAEQLLIELGHWPSTDEIAERCDVTPEEVLDTRLLPTAHRAMSLDVPLADDESTSRVDNVRDVDDGYLRVEQDVDIDRLLETLPEREQAIVRLRFFADMTQREIAAALGLSQMHVSRLIRGALATLAEHAPDDDQPELAAAA